MATGLFGSSIGRKIIMGLSGLFLVSFLIIHCSINALIFLNDNGDTFNTAAHFMVSNPAMKVMEIVLFAGFILHIIDGIMLWLQNRSARPVSYAVSNKSSKWYSRNMAILGTFILFFLVIHLSHFWFKKVNNDLTSTTINGVEMHNMYNEMLAVFSNPIWTVIYVVSCLALAYHLLHGFRSGFQTLGINHPKYNKLLNVIGIALGVVLPVVFALMPVAVLFNIIS